MNLYISFLTFNIIVMTVFSKNIDVKTSLEEPIPFSVGLKFITEINNLKDEDCAVEVYPDECCLYNNDEKCNIIEIMGVAADVINGGAMKTFKMVAPLLDAYQRRGYCTLYIDSRPVSELKPTIRDTVKIKFDTRLKKQTLPRKVTLCNHVDEDPLNNCNPVECDTYYNGKKSHFSLRKQRCIEIPTCMPLKTTVLKTVYNPISNKCIDNTALGKADIDYVKELSKRETRRQGKSVMLLQAIPTSEIPVIPLNTNYDIITTGIASDTTDKIKTMAKEKYDAVIKAKNKLKAKFKNIMKNKDDYRVTSKAQAMAIHAASKVKDRAKALNQARIKAHRKQKLENLMKYLKCNKYTVLFLLSISILQCCLICTLVYCMTKNCMCQKKPVMERYFNNKPEASATTPLIGTSRLNTECTECQYMSESSNNIEHKIKCYKACQKNRENKVKLSMSDDIISKCVTRRNWIRLPKSETIPEAKVDEDFKITKMVRSDHKKMTEAKVNFQDETEEIMSNFKKNAIKRDKKETKINKHLSNSSEKQIRCHTYNIDNNSKVSTTTLKNNSRHLISGVHSQSKQKAESIAKSAQACFSNDSIDEFLSEKGILCFDDIASKCTTSLSSVAKSAASTQSSRTSKNNIVRNIMNFLPKKLKGPSSDPGVKKTPSNLDLELLYVSRASLSSSIDTDGGKSNTKLKGSQGATKTFTMVAPLLDPYQRKGFCTLYIDSRPVSGPRAVTRDTIKVQFNTRLKKETTLESLKLCEHVDEDPLNDCMPVKCETYYNGKRSHFDKTQQRCTVIPTCLSLKSRIPKSIYNPVSNKCIKSRVGQSDIDHIRQLVKKGRQRNEKNTPDFNERELSNKKKIKRMFGLGTKLRKYEQGSSNVAKVKEKPKEGVNIIHGGERENPVLQDKVSKVLDEPERKEPLEQFGLEETTAPEVTVKNKSLRKEGIKLWTTMTPTTEDKSKPLLKDTDIHINEINKGDQIFIEKLKFALSSAKNWIKYKVQQLQYMEICKFSTVLPCILLLQCCLIFMMLICMNKNRNTKKKPIIKRYFNYRQDASVTTPLIGTSNIDTETTDCQYMSESSNYIDKKIKCYKAFHKDKQNSMKLSMSDDILSKCITRRDWLRLPRSETIPEVRTDEELKINKETSDYQQKGTEMKVNFQEQYQGSKNKNKNVANKGSTRRFIEKHLIDSSEKEIRCHNYNYENNSNLNSACKTFGIYGPGKKKSGSIEKGAQAYFSNDSIDEFLSERGVLFFGDNISKYSYSSLSSEARSTASSQSSRTSKNNMVKNVMSLLTKKVKGPSSDPGTKKSAAELDLELLQMSKTSLASSGEMERGKDVQRVKDSTSSL